MSHLPITIPLDRSYALLLCQAFTSNTCARNKDNAKDIIAMLYAEYFACVDPSSILSSILLKKYVVKKSIRIAITY